MRSDTKFIALDRTRSTLHLLKKSNFEGRDSLLKLFHDLQNDLRYQSYDSMELDTVLEPFLVLLRAPYLAGPFKQAALESIQVFVSSNIMSEFPSQSANVLTNMVHAITRCKFIQTDAIGDELVQLNIVQTLNVIVKSSSRRFMTGDTAWDIVETCQNILLQTATGGTRSAALCSSAERTLLDTCRLTFSAGQVPPGSPNSNGLSGAIGSASSPTRPQAAHAELEYFSACKLLAYFLKVLDKFASDAPSSNPRASRRSLARANPPLGDTSLDSETTELLLALKAINVMLVASRTALSTNSSILYSPTMTGLIRDDLCRCLVLLAARRDFVPLVLQSILSLFGTLFSLFGPILRVFIACFMPSVYLKALHQLNSHFAKQYDTIMRPIIADADNYPASTPAGGSMTPGAPTSINTNFNFDEMEMILESLGDLISDIGFLPTLFASFDCDPSSMNIVQPLVRYLCQCSRYSMVMEGQRVGVNSLLLYDHCTQCLRHILKTMTVRCGDRLIVPASTSTSTEKLPTTPSFGEDGIQSTVSIRNVEVDRLSCALGALRSAKSIFAEASRLFCVKPEKGLRYLQSCGALPDPLTPESVAKFLRTARELPKDVVGSFLGELGKDDASFIADSRDFHAKVLTCYVHSFSLDNQSVMNCMRIFLSAFRLPGEAQQIDRILVAFSEFCHSNCIEGRSGLLENAEITYLLTFSIIMLNTDRHNPNIRTERKMTTEQFVRNNTNYGPDLKQTIPLPQDFLEGIYNSIAECPIRTENNDVTSEITVEVWMDMQLQAAADVSRSTILSCCHRSNFIDRIVDCFSLISMENSLLQEPTDSMAEAFGTCTADQAALKLLSTNIQLNTLPESSHLDGASGFIEEDLFSCVWPELLSVAVCPFLVERNYQRQIILNAIPGTPAAEKFVSGAMDASPNSMANAYIGMGAGPNALQLSVDIFAILSNLATILHFESVLDCSLFILAEFSAILLGSVVDLLFSAIPNCLYFERFGVAVTALGSSARSTTSSPQPVRSKSLQPTSGFASPGAASSRPLSQSTGTDVFLDSMVNSVATKVALTTLLRMVEQHQAHIGAIGWTIVWPTLALLRDCVLLPREIVAESDIDILPAAVRAEFESRMKTSAEELARIEAKQVKIETPKKSKSFLSLQGLGEVIFGSNTTEESPASPMPIVRLNRWDDGYEDQIIGNLDSAAGLTPSKIDSSNAPNLTVIAPEYTIPTIAFNVIASELSERESHQSVIEETFRLLRQLVAGTGIAKLVSDSRFLSENSLIYSMSVITLCCEDSIGTGYVLNNWKTFLESLIVSFDVSVRASRQNLQSLNDKLHSIGQLTPRCSQASVSWLELVLVEISMRNRDRFTRLWPIIQKHYTTTLTAATKVNYVNERQVVGLFKIASRMLSREQLSGPILHMIQSLFIPVFESLQTNEGLNSSTSSTSRHHVVSSLVKELSSQISAGMWQLLTLNVSCLPSLHLEQWQVIFELIAMSSSSGGFASIKAFESMAWLLHEPRLRAEVPVFCIVALKPLLLNTTAPLSVSIGAIQLLSHLHTRLEVLIKVDAGPNPVDESSSQVPGEMDDDSAHLWESAWVPILQSLAEGTTDRRLEVRSAAVEALSHAILDRHAAVVPSGVLIHILGDILVPVLQHLGEVLVSAVQTELGLDLKSSKPPLPGSSIKSRDEKPTKNVVGQSNQSKIAFVDEAMCCLCTAFIRQLPKLSVYPSFDRLWLRFLHVFGYFLGAGHGFEDVLLVKGDLVDASNIRQQELIAATHLAQEKLRNMFQILVRSKIFRRRPELWVLTVEMVRQFVRCPGLADDPVDSSSPEPSSVEAIDEVDVSQLGTEPPTDARSAEA